MARGYTIRATRDESLTCTKTAFRRRDLPRRVAQLAHERQEPGRAAETSGFPRECPSEDTVLFYSPPPVQWSAAARVT